MFPMDTQKEAINKKNDFVNSPLTDSIFSLHDLAYHPATDPCQEEQEEDEEILDQAFISCFLY